MFLLAALGVGEGVGAFTVDSGKVSVPHLAAACVLFFLLGGGITYMRGRPRQDQG